MLRTVFFLLLTTFLCTCGSAPEVRNGVAEKPNIILIMTDDQGYGDLAAHGNPWLKTPNLDALHEASVRFTNFHVGTTCAPTRAGLMTGVNCNRTGAWHTVGGRSLLAERFVTLADELKEEGYATGIFGKWHLGDNYPYRPQDRGFEEVLIHGGGGVGQTPDYWENDYFDDTYFRNGSPEKFEGYCTDVWFRESMKYMEQKAAGNQPFFTYISTNAPHSPYHVEERYVAPYRGNDEIANPEFYGMIANADENIGRLLNWLEEKDLADNTIVVFLTDNGTSGGAYLDKQLHVKKAITPVCVARKASRTKVATGCRCSFVFRIATVLHPRNTLIWSTTTTSYLRWWNWPGAR